MAEGRRYTMLTVPMGNIDNRLINLMQDAGQLLSWPVCVVSNQVLLLPHSIARHDPSPWAQQFGSMALRPHGDLSKGEIVTRVLGGNR